MTNVSVGQLSVFLENKKGRIAELLSALAQEDIPVFGFSVAEVSDYGIVRILSSRGAEARQALQGHGFTVVENRVVSALIKAGTRDLANVVSILSNAGVNIEYLYLTTRQSVVLRVDDTEAVEDLLSERGFECVSDVQ
ncbi:MAG: amino acid-binding protein [Actinobacteria bacterium]|nr:amino acid-binding protein [Actinomycetota bacterium]